MKHQVHVTAALLQLLLTAPTVLAAPQGSSAAASTVPDSASAASASASASAASDLASAASAASAAAGTPPSIQTTAAPTSKMSGATAAATSSSVSSSTITYITGTVITATVVPISSDTGMSGAASSPTTSKSHSDAIGQHGPAGTGVIPALSTLWAKGAYCENDAGTTVVAVPAPSTTATITSEIPASTVLSAGKPTSTVDTTQKNWLDDIFGKFSTSAFGLIIFMVGETDFLIPVNENIYNLTLTLEGTYVKGGSSGLSIPGAFLETALAVLFAKQDCKDTTMVDIPLGGGDMLLAALRGPTN